MYRHWTVFCSGLAIVLIGFVITPFQSAIFSNDTITVVQNVPFIPTEGLLPPSEQASKLDASFLSAAYAYTWLGQKLPAFTSPQYAVIPSYAANTTMKPLGQEIWKMPTTLFQADLDCSPADVTPYVDLDFNVTHYNISNGQGCEVPGVAFVGGVNASQEFTIYSIVYTHSGSVNYWLQEFCPNISTHTMIALWTNGSSVSGTAPQSMTAVFCEASYYKQEVNASISSSDFSIQDVNITGPRTILSDSEFNITEFEITVGSGVSPSAKNSNLPDRVALDQQSRLASTALVLPTTIEVGFAIGNQNMSVQSYSNATNLETAFQAAHRLLFSLAVNQVLSTSMSPTNSSTGTRTGTLGAVTINRSISVIVEIFLGIACALTLALWYLSHNRLNYLTSDPAAITDVMSSVSGSCTILDRFIGYEALTADDLHERLHEGHYRIFKDSLPNGDHTRLEYIAATPAPIPKVHTPPHAGAGPDSRHHPTVRPKTLSLGAGLAFVSLLCLSVVGLVLLRTAILQQGGASLFTT